MTLRGNFPAPESPAWVLNGIIANRLELRNGKESGDHVELDQLFFLLIGEGVESASLEAGEGAVGWGENGLSIVGVVEFVIDLSAHLNPFKPMHIRVNVISHVYDLLFMGGFGWIISWGIWTGHGLV